MRRPWISFLAILGLFVLITLSLYLMANAAENSDRFGEWYVWLLVLNFGLLLILAALILSRLVVVARDLFTRVEGSRLTLRLILMFIFAALLPVLVVYGFSIRFLSQGIDSWFDVRIEDSLEDALELSQLSLEYRMRTLEKDVEHAVKQLHDTPDILVGLSLNDHRLRLGALELTLLGFNNRIIATSSDQTALVVPKFPAEDMLIQLGQGQNYVGLEPGLDDRLRIRVVSRVKRAGPEGDPRVLVALFDVSPRVSDLAGSVQTAFGEYKSLSFLRRPLKQAFKLTLSLVLLLSTLFAIWAAFFLSRRMLAPVVELASATRAVAEGDYQQRLPVLNHDELGFLVQSFNEMTSAIRHARESADLSQRLLEGQRSYLQAVLGHLSSGVLTLDCNLNLRTANDAADQILELEQPLQEAVGEPIASIAARLPLLQSLYEQLEPELVQGAHEWRREVRLFGERGRKVLVCRGVELPVPGRKSGGQVIVFDDVTALIQAQRDAAWGEVARRLAHEIKNPLTPIQLSAERLEHKLHRHLAPDQADVLTRATQTIVSQVQAMQAMVNAFRDYASTPPARLAPIDLNALIREVVELYQPYQDRVRIQVALDSQLPLIVADTDRIRQVLHNLLKNATEALGGEYGEVTIATTLVESGLGRHVELKVSDTGRGIAPEFMEHIFEPYVTNKHKGTGLGLAIVKKIVEEHGGMVTAANRADGGALFTVRLPDKYHPDEHKTITKEGVA
ncbi:MAG: ATP-binding protein [Thiotrichales bacterium]